METSLYIANEKIQFVCGTMENGKIAIDSFDSVALPEGTIINGVITDENEFRLALKLLKKNHADLEEDHVRITLGSAQALIKTRVVPKLQEYKMLEWMKGEFTGGDTEDEEYLYDYSILNESDEGDTAFLCALKKSVLTNYITLFTEENIKISCIDVALNSQIKLVYQMGATAHKTFLLLTLDGNMLEATLYVDGHFKVSNRMRLLAERQSSEMAEEIGRVVSNLIQFNITEKNDKNIEYIYMCGFTQDEAFVKDSVTSTYGLKLRELKKDIKEIEVYGVYYQDFVLDDYLYAVGNLIRE